MKNRISYVFILLALLFAFGGILTYSRHTFAEEIIKAESKSLILMDANSKTILYNKDELKELPIASMCKIMTLLICFEEIDENRLSLDETITISENASGMGGSQIFLEEGGEYSVEQLLKGIVVASANDACVALAERTFGSESLFVDKMNSKAKDLSMNNTVFINCTGLPKVGQYSCAKDVAIMFSELIKHHLYFKYSTIWLDEIKHPNDRVASISNTNKLIRFYQGCDGGKTGYTSEAGHCLTACAKRDGLRLISVVIGAPNSKTRFAESSSLLNYGFANYCSKTIVSHDKPLEFSVDVIGGKQSKISLIAEKDISLFCKKNEKLNLQLDFELDKQLKAPIVKGQIIGVLSIYKDGVLVDEVNVLSCDNVDCKSYYENLNDCIKNWALA